MATVLGRTNNLKNGQKNQKQIRNWCFTLNNPDDKDVQRIIDSEYRGSVNYMVFGVEYGKSGTQHLQGYIEFQRSGIFQRGHGKTPLRVSSSGASITRDPGPTAPSCVGK